MKKVFFIFTFCMFLVMLATPAFASPVIKVLIDGESITFDVNPVIRQGRTLIPVRKIVESIGGDVKWNPIDQTITITKDKTSIFLAVNSNIAKVNDEDKTLEVPAEVINGRVMAPLRFISENLNTEVKWDAANWTVILNTPKNIDEEAITLLLKAMEKSADCKKFNADFNGDIIISGISPQTNENLASTIEGNFKFDIEIPAFSFDGKITLNQGLKQELKFEMVFIDNSIYIKNPISGKWEKQSLPAETTEIFNSAIKQSVSSQVYYRELFAKGKDSGLFRNVSFAGEKTINGIDTKGVYLEVNGLKLCNFVKEYFANLDTTGFGPGLGTTELDKDELNKALDEAFSAVTMDKLNYTLWIGKNDNMTYGYDGEFRYGISNLKSGDKTTTPINIRFDFNFNMTISDINKPQGIAAPKIDQENTGFDLTNPKV